MTQGYNAQKGRKASVLAGLKYSFFTYCTLSYYIFNLQCKIKNVKINTK